MGMLSTVAAFPRPGKVMSVRNIVCVLRRVVENVGEAFVARHVLLLHIIPPGQHIPQVVEICDEATVGHLHDR